MPPFRVYLDTSVLGGAFDAEFKEDTTALLALFREGKLFPVVSEQVELEAAPQAVQELLDDLVKHGAERLELSLEAFPLEGAAHL